jgi:hypothetical protein
MTSVLRLAAIFGVSGSLLAVGVPTFVRNLHASRLSEALDGLDDIATVAIARAAGHSHAESFPPSVERTPEQVPRGVLVTDPQGTWNHLTWRALAFELSEPHAYSYRFDSSLDPDSGTARFVVEAQGDLDGDGNLSRLQVQGERRAREDARLSSGLLLKDELE